MAKCADADWATCPTTQQSVSGLVVQWLGCVVAWRCKKQPTLSLSTTKAEYKALGDALKEVKWIKLLLLDIDPNKAVKPATVLEDNEGAIKVALNQANHASFHTKHMEI